MATLDNTTPGQPSALSVESGLSHDWLRGLVEQTLAGIYIIQNGRFRYVNQGFADMFGFTSPDEIIGTLSIAELIAPEDRERVRENVRKRTDGEVPEMRYVFVGLRKDGRRIHVEVHGRSMVFEDRPAVIGLVLDVTERKLAEAASDEKLRGLFELSPLGITLADMECRIIECNDAFLRICGYSADRLGALDCHSLFFGLAEAEFTKREDSLERHGRYGPYEWKMRRKDGSTVPVQISGMRLTGRDGQRYVWSIIEDITERKRLEKEMGARIEELGALNTRLEAAQNQLLQAEKMSAVGQLAAGIAHEINNPIGFVNSNLGTLAQYLGSLLRVVDAYRAAAETCAPDNPALLLANQVRDAADFDFVRTDALTLLDESREGLDRVKRIVADLKDFSRVGESEWQMADVHKCLDSTLNVVWNELKYKAAVEKDYGELPNIRCMPFQLNQVFMNLLVNAAHAIPEKGTITLRTRREGETVWLEVEDTGVGIPPENVKRIFEPFFTTKPVGSGTGLGLSVAYGIVQKHGGSIDVRSAPGRGSVFRVTLPVDPTGGEAPD